MEDKIIKPGESKEITLVLTKNINQNDIKTIKNTANIDKTLSSDGNEDKNLQNNQSESNLIISIKTGKNAEYIILILILVTLFTIGVYEINKKFYKER